MVPGRWRPWAGSAETIITARHAGSDIVGMRSPVGEAVRWTVEERDRGGLRKVLWKPYEKANSSDGGASPAAEDVEAGQLAPGLPPVLSEAA